MVVKYPFSITSSLISRWGEHDPYVVSCEDAPILLAWLGHGINNSVGIPFVTVHQCADPPAIAMLSMYYACQVRGNCGQGTQKQYKFRKYFAFILCDLVT